MVKRSIVDKFVRLGGYETVKKKKGKWKNISLACKRTGISRPTIYAILEEYPDPPSKTRPKYIDEFEKSEGYRLLKEKYQKNVTPGTFQHRVKPIMKAWKFLNKKDPVSWNEQDYLKIWNMEKFIIPEIGFDENIASAFHIMMKLTKQAHLIDQPEFKGHKRPPGRKKEWFLQDQEIIDLCNFIDKPDVLVFDFAGTVWGARSSGMLATKVSDVHFEDYSITVYEPKTRQFVSKYPPIPFFMLLKKYVKDFNLQPEDPLFPNSYSYYNTKLQKAGKRAGIRKNVTTHILKHTFVSQGHRHRLTKETIIEMTGTEDQTIKKFYLSISEKKVRHETQGLEWDTISFYEWVELLYPYFEQKYVNLNGDTLTGTKHQLGG
jgi:integrase